MERPRTELKLRPYVLLSLLVTLLLIGCGDADSPIATPTPEATATPVPAEGSGRAGTVSASMNAECFMRDSGSAEIIVDYEAKATNDARVGRVRIFINDAILEDSGIINDIEYKDREVIPVPGGSQRLLRVEATPSGSAARATVQATVRCPGMPLPRS